MDRSAIIAILVSVIGFCIIVAVAFLTYKLKPRRCTIEPISPLSEHPNPSTLSFNPSFTRRFVIRDGHVVAASQTGTPSIRSGFSWIHHRSGPHSIEPSQFDLPRSADSHARPPRPQRKDVEKGIVDAVVESTLFVPERASILVPSAVGPRRPLSNVPEMFQIDSAHNSQARRLSWDVRQLLNGLRTETPVAHRLSHSIASSPYEFALHHQIHELPATPVQPRSSVIRPQSSAVPKSASSPSNELSLPVTPSSPSALLSPVEPTTPTSPLSSNFLLADTQLKPTYPSTTSIPGRLSMDETRRTLLRSKYNTSTPDT